MRTLLPNILNADISSSSLPDKNYFRPFSFSFFLFFFLASDSWTAFGHPEENERRRFVPDELGECCEPLDGVRDSWAALAGGSPPGPVGGLPPWVLRGELETGRIVSATEMSDCMGEGACPGGFPFPLLLLLLLLALPEPDDGGPAGCC